MPPQGGEAYEFMTTKVKMGWKQARSELDRITVMPNLYRTTEL